MPTSIPTAPVVFSATVPERPIELQWGIVAIHTVPGIARAETVVTCATRATVTAGDVAADDPVIVCA
jgi:hypothetical protein